MCKCMIEPSKPDIYILNNNDPDKEIVVGGFSYFSSD